MNCAFCKSENWKNVDKYRIKPEGMRLCQTCGFISYPDRFSSKEDAESYYKKSYRQTIPKVQNIFQGEKKINYHKAFLADEIKGWREAGKSLTVCDVGAAFGLALAWFRSEFEKGKCDVSGVDFTDSYIRNAWHLFQIPITQKFDDKKKYDLIMSYKTLEHIVDPEEELKKYIDCLKDDGYIYLSVPTWFHTFQDFGTATVSMDSYFHPDHINVWTRPQFETLIKICGGEIIKENHTMYGNTYLVKRKLENRKTERKELYEDPKQIEEKLNQMKMAYEAHLAGYNDRAIELYPNFPVAHIAGYERRKKEYHQRGFKWLYENVLAKAIKDCPDFADLHFFAGDICMRYDQFDLAVKHLKESLSMKPGHPTTISMLGNAFGTLASRETDEQERIQYLMEANKWAHTLQQISKESYNEAMNWILFNNSKLPVPKHVG